MSVYLQPLLRNRPQKATEFGEITQTTWLLRRSRSFKNTHAHTMKTISAFLSIAHVHIMNDW